MSNLADGNNIPQRLQNRAKINGSKPAIYWNENDSWNSLTWSEYHDNVCKFGGALLGLGFEAGDAVSISGNNSKEWIIACVGSMYIRALPAGIYQTSTSDQFQYVANHMEAKVLVLEDKVQWDKFESERNGLSTVKKVVMIKDIDKIDDEIAISFEDFLESGKIHVSAANERMKEIKTDDLALLIYTSGTTGPPKGVMLSHHNLAWTVEGASEVVGGLGPDDRHVAYLPLSHIAEQMFCIHGSISFGFAVWVCSAFDQIKEHLLEARPTLFLAVPRVWEKFKAALEARLSEASGIKAKIVKWSRKQGLNGGYKMIETGKGGVRWKIANKLFFSKLQDGLGLDKLKFAVTAAAPIGKDVLEFFLSCGIIIHEVYGLSESSGPLTFNSSKPGHRKLTTVGQSFPGVEVKIAEDGEILGKGGNIFQGYYKNEEATNKALVDGWLHSGDIGEIDENGFLKITDRKKDLIITAGGKNVSPSNIEKIMKSIKGVSQFVVIGDKRKMLTGLVTLDPEGAVNMAKENNWPTDIPSLAESDGMISYINSEVERLNKDLAKFETIKRIKILHEDFDVEHGTLTPSMKIKRKPINERYASQIETLYEN
ncbi:MAG: long-chain fatty acid--CoA ligase [Methanobacteriota archaeon]|nr:MAG: long-chain fatty acid--CoA ligase [Euryarchaeota archaeon]|tara:strand:- start:993 stop:2783 length:1791 start_codon:yes stop_codon:yes gene_type:complete